MLTFEQLGKTLYHQGDLSYFEAVNKETLKNAWNRYEEEGIIEVTKTRGSNAPPRSKLAPEWQPERDVNTGGIKPEGKLWNFIERIASSRREGKNRRDGATVSTRVLGLTDVIARKLFAEAQEVGEQGQGVNVGRKKRRGTGEMDRARL